MYVCMCVKEIMHSITVLLLQLRISNFICLKTRLMILNSWWPLSQNLPHHKNVITLSIL